jgi:hypothetical protein
VQYNFRISPELKRALELLKARDGMPESEAIRRALAEFLKRRRIPIATPKGGTTSPTRK